MPEWFSPVAVNNAAHPLSSAAESYSKCKSEEQMEFGYCFTSSGFIWFQWPLQDLAGTRGAMLPLEMWSLPSGSSASVSITKALCNVLGTSNSQQSVSACAEALGEQGKHIKISDGFVGFF